MATKQFPKKAPDLFRYPKYWASCFDPAPFLPMSREEMDQLGWDACDIILVTGDAYVDHPSFGMAVVGRLLEAQGYRVGIISQPEWHSTDDFMKLGEPTIYFGVTAGNMDSMVNRYTADRKVRNDDAYTAGDIGGKRPDRCTLVYSQKLKEAYPDKPVVIGGIEASLRRTAHYDYWTDKVRGSYLADANADILLYGNAERALVEVSHQLAHGKPVEQLKHIRGTAVIRKNVREELDSEWYEVDASRVDWPQDITSWVDSNPYESCAKDDGTQALHILPLPLQRELDAAPEQTYIRLPSFEKVRNDPALYAHTSRMVHLESNPMNARSLVQKHGAQDIWINPPAIPLSQAEMDGVFDLPYARVPHPVYGKAKIPAFDMIKTSVNIMRGCYGGCTFCSITEHEGRVIQSRSHDSIVREVEAIRDKVPGFTGSLSDLGGPTANMYETNCSDPEIHANCRRLSCLFPTVCSNLSTSQKATTELYRKVRKTDGIHTVNIASGVRYDLAVKDPEYVKELVQHHVGGYLKIAPEHTEERPLNMMMKPSTESYEEFERMFYQFSEEAGKKQYLIPYFIAAHPGCEDEDMLNLALWLKERDLKVDQVQTFYPTPMSIATAMYHTGKNPLGKVSYKSGNINTVRDAKSRTIQKSLLRYHDPNGWEAIRDALKAMGKQYLIGNGKNALVPAEDPDDRHSRGGRRESSHEPQKPMARGSKDHMGRDKKRNGQSSKGGVGRTNAPQSGGKSGQKTVGRTNAPHSADKPSAKGKPVGKPSAKPAGKPKSKPKNKKRQQSKKPR